MNNNVRVRFAPSPTGPLHIGGVRTALYNYLFARKHNGSCILRIEDTDQTRYVDSAEDYILNSLDWCGIEFDESLRKGGDFGPYHQSERKHLYRRYADKLVEKGHAYYAFDTQQELDVLRSEYESQGKTFIYNQTARKELRNSITLSNDEVQSMLEKGEPYVIRIKIPEDDTVELTDLIRGHISVHTKEMDDKVLYKADGMPTYHLANIVDDHLMEITHVIRGEEWLPSAPLHVLLYKFLDWKAPAFAHLPLLLKPDGAGKLSKRDGDRLGFPVFPLKWKDPKTGEEYMGYRDSGYFPEAFINILAFLGWNPGTEKELYTLDELIKDFSLERVGKSGSRFDPDKARWFNHQYLIRKSDREIAERFMTSLDEKGISANIHFVEKAVSLVKERVNFVREIWDEISFMFIAPTEYDPKVVKKKWKEHTPGLLSELLEQFRQIDPSDFTAENIEEATKDFLAEKDLGMGQIMNAFRLTIVGGNKGPSMFHTAEILGKEEVLKRMEYGINHISRD
ncbi:MAG: glutamate--tRNA ligase [Bacteroidales bacterium]|nr:glutamate--tRNA ligase [Bacteroidales bacterium]